MYYSKPKDITYTDMCIFIDNTAYKPDKTNEDREKIYLYIY